MTDDQMVRKDWDAVGYDAVGLWRHLLRYGYVLAAWGLLAHLLFELWHFEHGEQPATPEAPLADGTPVSEARRARLREWLMEILGDDDGQYLRVHLDAYVRHREKHGDMPLVPTRGLGVDLLEYVVHTTEVFQAQDCREHGKP
jgi:hypothetical protein